MTGPDDPAKQEHDDYWQAVSDVAEVPAYTQPGCATRRSRPAVGSQLSRTSIVFQAAFASDAPNDPPVARCSTVIGAGALNANGEVGLPL